ncbi:MAG: hypothetical protein KTR21_05230 [Rhodobacteraceae bacterium]|nr:hypothetical protein [Paracoccaceae bacterium]
MTARIILIRTLIIWMCVWPIVMAGLLLLRLVPVQLPLALQTFVLTVILAPMISLFIGPGVARMIRPKSDPS